MPEWEGFEIVCVDVNQDDEYDDCRAIEQIGFLAPSLNLDARVKAWESLEKRPYWYHVEINGEQVHPVPDKVGNRKFIRVADENTPDDPLLELPSCAEYKRKQQLEAL